jgi:hypothetical protein
VIVINLDPQARESYVALDEKFFAVGVEITNLLGGDPLTVHVAPDGKTPCVYIQLEPRQMAILKAV